MSKKNLITAYNQLGSSLRNLVDEKLSNGEKKIAITFRNKKVAAIFIETEQAKILVPLIIEDDVTIDDIDFDSIP